MVTVTEFLIRYPELQPVPPSLIEPVLLESEQDCPPVLWGVKRNRGIMLLSAHVLALRWIQIGEIAGQAATLASGGGGSGSAGGVGEDDLDATEYGRQFKRLQSQLFKTSTGTAAASAVFVF